jgi:hypothetical protein
MKRRAVWLLEEVGLNCVSRGERDIYWWGVLIYHIVCKDVELWGEMEWGDLSSYVFPQL